MHYGNGEYITWEWEVSVLTIGPYYRPSWRGNKALHFPWMLQIMITSSSLSAGNNAPCLKYMRTLLPEKQVSQAGISNYIPQFTVGCYSCLWYLLLAAKSTYSAVVSMMVGTLSLTRITARIRNHRPSKVWDYITYPFPSLNGLNNFIPHFIMDVIIYPC